MKKGQDYLVVFLKRHHLMFVLRRPQTSLELDAVREFLSFKMEYMYEEELIEIIEGLGFQSDGAVFDGVHRWLAYHITNLIKNRFPVDMPVRPKIHQQEMASAVVL